jgi:hypothetical protein
MSAKLWHSKQYMQSEMQKNIMEQKEKILLHIILKTRN